MPDAPESPTDDARSLIMAPPYPPMPPTRTVRRVYDNFLITSLSNYLNYLWGYGQLEELEASSRAHERRAREVADRRRRHLERLLLVGGRRG